MSFERLAIVSVIATSIGFLGDLVRDYTAPCPPYDQCSGSAGTNHPNCKCWEHR